MEKLPLCLENLILDYKSHMEIVEKYDKVVNQFTKLRLHCLYHYKIVNRTDILDNPHNDEYSLTILDFFCPTCKRGFIKSSLWAT